MLLNLVVADIDQGETISLKLYDYQNNLIQLAAKDIFELGSNVNVTYTSGNSITLVSKTAATSYDGSTSNVSNIKLQLLSIVKRIEFYKTAGANNTWVGLLSACDDSDTDKDGISNHLDLDSDGDGCSDAIEAKSSSSETSVSVFPTGNDSNSNGLLTVYESTTAGVVNYVSSYNPYAISANLASCKDIDGDGISNDTDLDDDNDGILDAVESPTCFMTANEWNTLDKTVSVISITSALNTLSPNNKFSALTDNDGTVAAVQFSTTTAQTQLNKEIFKVEFSSPTQLDALYIKKTTATEIFAATASSLQLQGSNDNFSTFTNLTAAITLTANATNITANGAVSLTNSNKFTVTTGAGKFKYYRIYGVLSANILAGIASEFYFDVNNATYQASYYPKAACTNDTDGDGKLNHQDLDSDGDACSDAIEAGSSTTATSTTDFPTSAGNDSNSNGLLNNYEGTTVGTVNYTSTYTSYAITNTINACTDSDGDGVKDVIDIDDDNDGVLDVVECTPFDINNLNYTPLNYTVSNGASSSQTFPAAPDGLVVNVWNLDNSFNIKINGKHLVTPQELEFYPGATTNSVFEFLDGTDYGAVWTINGSQSKPLIRVYIDKFLTVIWKKCA
jgi:hypothetical protein